MSPDEQLKAAVTERIKRIWDDSQRSRHWPDLFNLINNDVPDLLKALTDAETQRDEAVRDQLLIIGGGDPDRALVDTLCQVMRERDNAEAELVEANRKLEAIRNLPRERENLEVWDAIDLVTGRRYPLGIGPYYVRAEILDAALGPVPVVLDTTKEI